MKKYHKAVLNPTAGRGFEPVIIEWGRYGGRHGYYWKYQDNHVVRSWFYLGTTDQRVEDSFMRGGGRYKAELNKHELLRQYIETP